MAEATSATLADLQRARTRAEEEIAAVLLALEERYGVTVHDVDVLRDNDWTDRGDAVSRLEGVSVTLKL